MRSKPIRYCDHLEKRLELRSIDRELPARIISQPERLFDDTVTGYRIAVSSTTYRGEEHLMMVVFQECEDEIIAITTHPLEMRDVETKMRSGRWKPWL
ncbi:MAG: hypothetical protein V3W34_00225 [Phycisphaerae bacterium]